MALYLEGKTPLARMIFPPRRQLNESRYQVYRHGRAQGSDRDRGAERQWQAGDGVDRGNQSQQHSAVYTRSAGRVACDLGRRDLGGLALRSAATPGGASAGLRSAAQCLIKGLGGSFWVATVLNDSGEVSGGATTQDDQEFHAFFWRKVVMTDIGTICDDT